MCLIIMSHYILKLQNYVGSNKHKFLLIFIISMALSYIVVMFMRSTDQIEASISGLVWRACQWLMLLWSWLVVLINVTYILMYSVLNYVCFTCHFILDLVKRLIEWLFTGHDDAVKSSATYSGWYYLSDCEMKECL